MQICFSLLQRLSEQFRGREYYGISFSILFHISYLLPKIYCTKVKQNSQQQEILMFASKVLLCSNFFPHKHLMHDIKVTRFLVKTTYSQSYFFVWILLQLTSNYNFTLKELFISPASGFSFTAQQHHLCLIWIRRHEPYWRG